MSRRITVSIGPDGTISAEVSGASGPACLSSYDTIGKLIPGATVVDSKLTDEYHATSTDSAAVQNRTTENERLS
ncbi:DUF2997 domain-containing protein [Sinomonas atrocyanea]|uniref:DUF2997 domain-containing protein n=1 Tax=Sinomonas atrocyanea TaxID=37927 RepID=UPI003D97AE77